MEIKRKFELISATNRRFVVRRQSAEPQAVCTTCGKEMLTAEQVATMFNISQRNVFKIIEAGTVHFTELDEGGVTLICFASFADLANGRDQDGDPKLIY